MLQDSILEGMSGTDQHLLHYYQAHGLAQAVGISILHSGPSQPFFEGLQHRLQILWEQLAHSAADVSAIKYMIQVRGWPRT